MPGVEHRRHKRACKIVGGWFPSPRRAAAAPSPASPTAPPLARPRPVCGPATCPSEDQPPTILHALCFTGNHQRRSVLKRGPPRPRPAQRHSFDVPRLGQGRVNALPSGTLRSGEQSKPRWRLRHIRPRGGDYCSAHAKPPTIAGVIHPGIQIPLPVTGRPIPCTAPTPVPPLRGAPRMLVPAPPAADGPCGAWLV